jgi:hypothetical protein
MLLGMFFLERFILWKGQSNTKCAWEQSPADFCAAVGQAHRAWHGFGQLWRAKHRYFNRLSIEVSKSLKSGRDAAGLRQPTSTRRLSICATKTAY